MRRLLLLVALVACGGGGDADGDGVIARDDCDDSDPGVGGAVELLVDADGDGFGDDSLDATRGCAPASGFATAGGDCDDDDATIHPDAVEICDELDDDCDGTIDGEDAVDAGTWYPDKDGDGYGVTLRATVSCSAPTDHVAVGGDCDDTDPALHPATAWHRDADGDHYGHPDDVLVQCEGPRTHVLDGTDCDDAVFAVHPGAVERCNGVDDDCDEVTDGPGALGSVTFYLDADGDGFGAEDGPLDACERPAGYAPEPSDCDDTQARVHPGADETCDEVDEDCDGGVDEDAIDAPTWFLDRDGDTFGGGLPVSACEQPTGHVSDGSDCDDRDAWAYPGAVEECNGADDDCDSLVDDAAVDAPTWCKDVDADGHGDPTSCATRCEAYFGEVANDTDCDDGATTVHPGAPEHCDGVDDDCDGSIDEVDDAVDAFLAFADGDGDGFGAGTGTATCALAAGESRRGGDCDDADDTAFPGAPETDCDDPVDRNCDGFVGPDDHDGDGFAACEECDDGLASTHPGGDEVCGGGDEDCDGEFDEDDAIDAVTWYVDVDGDGYGVSTKSTVACEGESGWVAVAGDCLDTLPRVHPGAEELCDGRLDEDCDGLVDESDAADVSTFYEDSDGDGWGVEDATTRACAAPTGFAEDVGDCDDDEASINPDEGETCEDGVDQDCDGTGAGCGVAVTLAEKDAAATFDGATTSAYAGFLRPVGDLDGDGVPELVIGAPAVGTDVGAIYVFDELPSGTFDETAADWTLSGGSAGDYYGFAFAGVGDLDGDGTVDLAVTAGSFGGGDVHVFLGPVATGTAADADLVLTGAASSGTGAALAGGDVDGDGQSDLLIGAPSTASYAGAAYVVAGPGADGVLADEAAAVVEGDAAADRAGAGLAAADVDGDGVADLIVGADGYSDSAGASGRLWVFTTAPSGAVTTSDADGAIEGSTTAGTVGAVLSGGDIDGDGLDDVLVGTSDAFGTTGAAWVYLGASPFSGVRTSDDAWLEIDGARAGDYVGTRVALADFDAAGDLDLALTGSTHKGATWGGGAAFVLLGPEAGLVDLRDGADGLLVGGSGWGFADSLLVGDFDDDGAADLVLGLPYRSGTAVYGGAALVFLGVGL